jgi:hypothetical protein
MIKMKIRRMSKMMKIAGVNENVIQRNGCVFRMAMIVCSAWSSIVVSYVFDPSYTIGEVFACGVLWPIYMILAIITIFSFSAGWQAVMTLGMVLIGASFFIPSRMSVCAISAGFFLCNLNVLELFYLSMSV